MKYDFRSKTNQYLIDGAITAASFYLAFQIRFEGDLPAVHTVQLWLFPLMVAGRLSTSFLCGIHRQMWRYTTVGDGFRLALAYFAFSMVLGALRLWLPESLAILRLPLGVIAIEYLLSVTGSFGVRLLRHYLYKRELKIYKRRGKKEAVRRVLLVGAGTLGTAAANELAKYANTKVVGFLDDDPKKAGARIAGYVVLGSPDSLLRICQERAVDEVLVCIRPTARNSLNRLWNLCDAHSIPVRIIPALDEILSATADLVVFRRKPEPPPVPIAVPASASAAPVSPPRPTEQPVRGKTILITGGAGFIGSALAEKLVSENELLLLDRTFDQQPVSFTSLRSHPHVQMIEGDILDTKLVQELAKNAHIIIHTAAILGVQKVCEMARETMEVNFVGTSQLLHSLESNGHLERFVYFSTSEVYGTNSFRVDEQSPTVVGAISEARWSYATAKLAGEHLVNSYFREQGLPGVIIRPFNIFGPRRIRDHALLRFIVNALTGLPLEVYGDGSQIRSWCYIDDFCAALLATLQRPETAGEDFNIGNPKNTYTAYQLACRVLDAVGSKGCIVFADASFPDVAIRIPSVEKARRWLGYEPSYDIDRALKLTVDWYRQNLNFFNKGSLVSGAALARNSR